MQTTKSGADRVESLPFTFKDDRTEMWGTLDHMRKNGPGVLQHVEAGVALGRLGWRRRCAMAVSICTKGARARPGEPRWGAAESIYSLKAAAREPRC